jgi:hypothetical protein
MTAHGVEYLNKWVAENAPPGPARGDVLIRALAQKLRDDASAAGFTIADMEIEGSQVEQYIRKTITQVARAGN